MSCTYVAIVLLCLATFVALPAEAYVKYESTMRCVAMLNEATSKIPDSIGSPEKARLLLESWKEDPILVKKDGRDQCFEVMQAATEISQQNCHEKFIPFLNDVCKQNIKAKYLQRYLFDFLNEQRGACKKALKGQLEALWSKLDSETRKQMDRLSQQLPRWAKIGYARRASAPGPWVIDMLVDALRRVGYENDELFTSQMYDAELKMVVEAVKAHAPEFKELIESARWKPPTERMETLEVRLAIVPIMLSIVDGSFYQPDSAIGSQQIEAVIAEILPEVADNKKSAAFIGEDVIAERVLTYLRERYREMEKEQGQEKSGEEKEEAIIRVLHNPCSFNWLQYEAEKLFRDVGLHVADEQAQRRLENLRTMCKVVESLGLNNIREKVIGEHPDGTVSSADEQINNVNVSTQVGRRLTKFSW